MDWFVSIALAIGFRRNTANNTINSIIPRFMMAPYLDG
jgi:hypothetical protein